MLQNVTFIKWLLWSLGVVCEGKKANKALRIIVNLPFCALSGNTIK